RFGIGRNVLASRELVQLLHDGSGIASFTGDRIHMTNSCKSVVACGNLHCLLEFGDGLLPSSLLFINLAQQQMSRTRSWIRFQHFVEHSCGAVVSPYPYVELREKRSWRKRQELRESPVFFLGFSGSIFHQQV